MLEFGLGSTCIIVEVPTKQYPTRFKVFLNIQYLNASPWPESLNHFNRGVLTISHMDGADSFPCLRPWVVGGYGLRVTYGIDPF